MVVPSLPENLTHVFTQDPQIQEHTALGKEKNDHQSCKARRFDLRVRKQRDPG